MDTNYWIEPTPNDAIEFQQKIMKSTALLNLRNTEPNSTIAFKVKTTEPKS